MPSMLTVWRIFARRGLSNWPLLAVLGLGVLMASTLLAAAPIYARTMADLGLTFTIREQLVEPPAAEVIVRDVPLAGADGNALQNAIETQVDRRLGWFMSSRHRFISLGLFIVRQAGQEPQYPFVGRLQSLSGYEEHVLVTEGRLPVPTGPSEAIEVAISTATSATAKLSVGSRFVLREDFDTCERVIPQEDPPPPPVPCDSPAIVVHDLEVVVVGLIEPVDADSRFWPLGATGYFVPFRLLPDTGPLLPMFAAERALTEDFASRFPAYHATGVTWHVFPEPTALTRANYHRAVDDFTALAEDLRLLDGFAIAPLKATLLDFDRQAPHKETPVLILLIEISGVALFYVLLMSLVVVERRAGEIALLRGRGASTFQVVLVYLFDGLLVGVPTLLVAPLLAAAVIAVLGWIPSFENINDGHMLPVTITLRSFGMAAAGVGLALAALSVPVFVVARRGAMAQRRAEARPEASFIQRYYLDLVLAGVAGLMLWELNERGSVFTPGSSVGLSSDPLLLASPVLLITAAAALLLRFAPLALRIVARFAALAAGVAVVVALWQVVRNPGQYTRLALLLMMAVAVGTFAASYASTTERSYRDRAHFQAGVPYRALGNDAASLGRDGLAADERLSGIEGVEFATAVTRFEAYPATPGGSGVRVQALGVNPPAAAQLLWSRSDFADRPLGELLGLLGGPAELGGRQLPGDPQELSVWVYTGEPRADVTLWARVRDSNREYGLVELGVLDDTGWRELKGAVHGPYAGELAAPISLVSLIMTEPANRPAPARIPIYVDDIVVTDAAGNRTVVEDFESAFRWAAILERAQPVDTFEPSDEQKHGGRLSGKFAAGRTTSAGLRGFYIVSQYTPIPAIASESFVAATGAVPGATVLVAVGDVVVPVTVRASYRLFPTMPSSAGTSIVFNRDHLRAFLNLADPFPPGGFNEAWFSLEEGTDREALEEALREPGRGLTGSVDLETSLASIEQNPLISAGGGAILFVSFAVLLILVSAALLVSLWVAVQRRRAEFAILRAMGLSRTQVLGQLLLEYAIVAVIGIGAGAYLGILVGRRMLSFLNVTEQGARVEPSFILQTDWVAVAAGGGAVLAGFAAALGLAVVTLSRTSDAAALRRE